MLLPSFLSGVSDKVVELWEDLNLYAVRSMAKKIAAAGGHMTKSADYQKYILTQSGKSVEELKKELSKTLEQSEEAVEEIFKESLQTSFDNDAEIFNQSGVETEPFSTEHGSKYIQTLYEQTNGTLQNYTNSMAENYQTTFINACDKAMAKVTSGLESPEQAIREAIEESAEEGLTVSFPSGRTDMVEVAVRRAVMTGVNQASLRQTIDECERQGTNFVIVSSHLGARTSKTSNVANHALWQGQVYRIDEDKEDFYGALSHLNGKYNMDPYALLEDATGYPNDPTGLGGYNCRHTMYPFVPGVSENHMTIFDEDENEEQYKATQKQRAMERKLRVIRREIEALKAAQKESSSDEIKNSLKQRRAEYKAGLTEYQQFCKEHGLAEQLNRTYTAQSK